MRPVFIFGGDPGSRALLGALLASHESFVETPPFTPSYLRAARGGLFASTFGEAALGEGAWSEAAEPYLDALGGIQSAGPEALGKLVEAYAYDHGREEASVWLEHATPEDISLLSGAFPEARFVHLVRDGRAVAAARWQQPGEARRPGRLARTWRKSLLRGLEAEEALGKRCLRVSYEALLSDLRTGLEALARELGVPARSFRITPAVLDKDYGAHLYGWRTQLTPFETREIESVSGSLLTECGYALEALGSSLPGGQAAWQRVGRLPLRPARPVSQKTTRFEHRSERPRL